jgi:RES domain-containing protein
MPFQSSDAFRLFYASVTRRQRYVHEDHVRQFLDAVRETSVSRISVVPKDFPLWRAQRGSTYRWEHPGESYAVEIPAAYEPERMKPTASYATDGRVNPHGIAYLYLAMERDTACAEVRPWVGAYISLGCFRTNREMRLIDCTSDQRKFPFKAFNAGMTDTIPWSPEEYEGVVWGEIGAAMSEPVAPEDSRLDYVPTQILAEALLGTGVDGIVYRSKLVENGINIALFNVDDARLYSCQLMEATKVKFTFDESDNAYFIKSELDTDAAKRRDPENQRDEEPKQ